MKQNVTPFFIKTVFGKRIIVAQTTGTQPVFSISKQSADLIKEDSGFSKKKKLFTRYQGKDFQIMETSEKGGDTLKAEKTMDEKLAELKKKHPQKKLKLLQLDDPNLNVSFMMRSRLCLVLINNVPYRGILATKVEHSWEYPPYLRVQMIVDAGEFETSTNKARGIISQYEKHSSHHRKHDESGI